MIMEGADADFVRGLRYLKEAWRCERLAGDDTEGGLAGLATVYRARGCALMGVATTPGVVDVVASAGLRTLGRGSLKPTDWEL